MEESHCSFNLHFQSRIMVREAFHVLLCQSYIFLGEISLQIFGPLISLDLSLLLSFESSLYILDTSSLSGVLQIFFSQSITCLLISLTILQRAKVLNFGEVQLMNFFFMFFFSVPYLRHLCLTNGHIFFFLQYILQFYF